MTKQNQTDAVLSWLRTHGELTSRDAFIELNIVCLPRRIKDLRNQGHRITTEYRVSDTGKRYGVYKLINQEGTK